MSAARCGTCPMSAEVANEASAAPNRTDRARDILYRPEAASALVENQIHSH